MITCNSRFLICLAALVGTVATARAQTETMIANGFEPIISADRYSGTGQRVQLVYMQQNSALGSIWRAYSGDQGGSWATAVQFSPSGSMQGAEDPVACCNISAGAPPVMYFGWLQAIGTGTGFNFARSTAGNSVDSGDPIVAVPEPLDRPWLTCNATSLYASYSSYSSYSGSGPFEPYVTSLPIAYDQSDWSTATTVTIAAPDTSCLFISDFPVAAQIDASSNDVAYVLARQYYTGSGSPPLVTDNSIKVWRSANGGTWTNVVTENDDSAIGFYFTRDEPMVPQHICCDPYSSWVYTFFVKNESASTLGGPSTTDVLRCMASNGGTTWGGANTVYSLPPTSLPSSFATEPVSGGTIPGYYRIGRVSSCVDPHGNVFVCWMDNRYGQYSSTDIDYWHVFYSESTDHGSTWSTPVRVSDPLDTTLSTILSNASIGGAIGNPAGHGTDCTPPGDFLSCDADGTNLYVAWPDTRSCQGSGTTAQVYVGVVPL